MSGPYQGRDLSNCGAGRLHVAINCGVLSVKISFSHYDLNDTGIGGAKNHGLKNGSTFKVQPLHLSLPVVVQFLHGIIAVTEGGDRVRLDSLT